VKINTGNKDGGSSWMQWSRAAEYVRMGEMEAAYVEILGTGEELLLLRLLSRTGPVLEQLSSDTVLHVVCTLTQLLQQQSVLDCVLPWIQQVHTSCLTLLPRFLCSLYNFSYDLFQVWKF
jgi:hypothetical protein